MDKPDSGLANGKDDLSDPEKEVKTNALCALIRGRDATASEVIQLIKEGAQFARKKGWPALAQAPVLVEAAKHNLITAIATLLDLGADINGTDYLRGCPLQVAIYEGHIEAVKLLLARGALIHNLPEWKAVCLHHAVFPISLAVVFHFEITKNYQFERVLEIVEELLRYGADPNVERMGPLGDASPLAYSVNCHDLRLSQLLIDYNADLHWEKDGHNVISHALSKGAVEHYKFFRARGVKITNRAFRTAMEHIQSESSTRKDIPKSILLEIINDQNFSPNDPDGPWKLTPLDVTLRAKSPDLDLVRALCARGADCNQVTGTFGYTILSSLNDTTLTTNLVPMLQLLLDNGADINMEKQTKDPGMDRVLITRVLTALAALDQDPMEIIEFLQKNGYDFSRPIGRGTTVLMWVCGTRISTTNIKLLRYLIPLSKLDAEDKDKRTALQHCVMKSNFIYYQILVEAGAKEEALALPWMAEYHQKDLMSALLKWKKPCITITFVGDSKVGKTALMNTYWNILFSPTQSLPQQRLEELKNTHSFDFAWKDGAKKLSMRFQETSQAELELNTQQTQSSCRDTDVLLLVYSAVNHASFHNIESKWCDMAAKYYPGVPKLLVGTRSDYDWDTSRDLEDQGLEPIERAQADSLAQKIGVKFEETLATYTHHVNKVINAALILALTKGKNKKTTKKTGEKQDDCRLS